MRQSILLIATAAAASAFVLPSLSSQDTSAPVPTPDPPLGTNITTTDLPLGADCNPRLKNACANGVDCYGVTAFTIPRCGAFQSSCTVDSQCASTTCNKGFCNGYLPASNKTTPAPAGNPTPDPPLGTNITTTDLPLGADCNPRLKNACANGVDCYGVTAFTIPRCGAFQSSCTVDSQCASTTCNKGFCNGYLPPKATKTPSGDEDDSPSP